jgi:hypothetical protein
VQSTSHILLVRPVAAAYNPETAASNTFQRDPGLDAETILLRVQAEFDGFVSALRAEGVDVTVIEDTKQPEKPDAVFPNNWISFHEDGRVILYPMQAHSRRRERRLDVIELLKKSFSIREVVDLSVYEKEGRYLEGTGSMVLDHVNKIAYAALSPRTHEDLFIRVCDLLKYRPVTFHANDQYGKQIYHTNVMMCVGERFSVACLESIVDFTEKKLVKDSLRDTGHTVIEISFDQMNHFAGNMLVIQSGNGESLLVCSRQSAESLSKAQKMVLSRHARMLPIGIPTIEAIGGGSARCMVAEVFLPLSGNPQ